MQKIGGFFCKRLFTPEQCLEDVWVEIEGVRISEIKSGHGKSGNLFDAGNLTAAPGFVDVHIQGCGGSDFLDATSEAVHTIRRTALSGGCTSLLATITFDNEPGAFDRLTKVVNAIKQGSTGNDGACIPGIHLEGPYLNPEKRGGFGRRFFRKPSRDEFLKVLEIVGDALKMVTVAPEIDGVQGIISEALRRGIVVSLGHTTATYEQARATFALGVNHITHIFNAMDGIHHRAPGLPGAALEDDNIFVQVIADGIHIHPAVLKLLYGIKGAGRICLITDATAPGGMPEGTELEGVGGSIVVRNGAVRLSDGTLAGSALLMDKAVRRMHKLAGVPLGEALRMASLTPATAIGLEDEIGSVYKGLTADFVLFDDDLKIRYVVHNGYLIDVGD